MLVAELLSTCSHPSIAEAAVKSIGFAFSARVARAAEDDDLPLGEFVARAVMEFRDAASEADWRELSDVCQRQDMPILCGLHHILEAKLELHRGWQGSGAARGPAPDIQSGLCCA
ncbi:MAG: hypothetical protein Q7T73_01715 [Beijerinckiaceae bacterium]|nr:hypothetical protein [Beijerinckiaceae bacterium]